MNDLMGGVQLTHTMSSKDLLEGLSEAWLQLRFCSPLIASQTVHGSLPSDLGSWVYTPVDSQGALKWRDQSFHVHSFSSALNTDVINDFIQQRIIVKLPYDEEDGLLFHGHVLVEESTNNMAIILHSAHTILDGPGRFGFPPLWRTRIQSSKKRCSTAYISFSTIR